MCCIAGSLFTGCGNENNNDNFNSGIITKDSYVKVARLSYMRESNHINSANTEKIKIPANNIKKQYPADLRKVIKKDNQLQISSEISENNKIQNIYIENDTSKIHLNIDENIIKVSLYKNSSLVDKKEFTKDEFFEDLESYFQGSES
jgi:hypothetical protein